MNSLSYLPYSVICGYIFVLGLCVGSFLNVVILRGLSGENIVFARSKCPKCNKQLKWYMNIPLISYLFLRGKCAFCKTHISIQYPIIEFITGVGFLSIFLLYGYTLKVVLLWAIFSMFIVLFTTDFKETVILDGHAYVLAGLGLLYSFLNFGYVNIVHSAIGMILGFLIFELLSYIGVLLVKYRMFGEGDSYIALGIGAIFGPKYLLIVIVLSFLIQCLYAVPVLAVNSFELKKIKLGISYILVFIAMFFVFLLNNLTGLKYLIALFAVVVSMIFALKNILADIKTKKLEEIEDFEQAKKQLSIMPFGPAFVIAATACLVYLPEIKAFILHYILLI